MTTLIWLAATTPPVSPGTTTVPKPDTVSPGFAGFLTIFLLAIATILLIRSMVKHLRTVRYSPDPAGPPAGSAAHAPTVSNVSRSDPARETPAKPGKDHASPT